MYSFKTGSVSGPVLVSKLNVENALKFINPGSPTLLKKLIISRFYRLISIFNFDSTSGSITHICDIEQHQNTIFEVKIDEILMFVYSYDTYGYLYVNDFNCNLIFTSNHNSHNPINHMAIFTNGDFVTVS